jgi:hypothetical protein
MGLYAPESLVCPVCQKVIRGTEGAVLRRDGWVHARCREEGPTADPGRAA